MAHVLFQTKQKLYNVFTLKMYQVNIFDKKLVHVYAIHIVHIATFKSTRQ